MKKIMFNDHYGLTQAVIDGRKTMTRRLINLSQYEIDCLIGKHKNNCEGIMSARNKCRYKIGEVVAVAQSYEQIYHQEGLETMDMLVSGLKYSAGWTNKMFTKAKLMSHYVRITDIYFEQLQDISDKDCLKEGIWEAENVGLPGVTYWYGGLVNSEFRNPREAFASLIDKISGRSVWASNPWVIVYSIENI